MQETPPPPVFEPALFEFLTELKANNQRDWFEANKRRYDFDAYLEFCHGCMALHGVLGPSPRTRLVNDSSP